MRFRNKVNMCFHHLFTYAKARVVAIGGITYCETGRANEGRSFWARRRIIIMGCSYYGM